MYYQRTHQAKTFKKTTDENGSEKFQPCHGNYGFEGTEMSYKDIESGNLLNVKLSFKDLQFILEKTRCGEFL